MFLFAKRYWHCRKLSNFQVQSTTNNCAMGKIGILVIRGSGGTGFNRQKRYNIKDN